MRGAFGTRVRSWCVVIAGCALRSGYLLGDGPHLLLGDVRVVLDGERDGEVRFVELIPETSQAADSADARPSHTPSNCRRGEQKKKGGEKETKRPEKEEKSDQRLHSECRSPSSLVSVKLRVYSVQESMSPSRGVPTEMNRSVGDRH